MSKIILSSDKIKFTKTDLIHLVFFIVYSFFILCLYLLKDFRSAALNNFIIKYDFTLFSKSALIYLFISWIFKLIVQSHPRRTISYLLTSHISISILGSLIVAIFTAKNNSTVFLAPTLALVHFNIWAFLRQNIQNARHEKNLKDNIGNLNHILDKYPDIFIYSDFKKWFIGAHSFIQNLYINFYDTTTKGLRKDLGSNEKIKLKENTESYITVTLNMLLGMCASWARDKNKYFEANIMLLKETSEYDHALHEEAMKNSEIFFPKHLRKDRTKNISQFCKGLLIIQREFSNLSSHKDNVLTSAGKPLLLPVQIDKSYLGQGAEYYVTPGAREACEKSSKAQAPQFSNVEDVNKIAATITYFSSVEEEIAVENYYKNCGFSSVLSISIPITSIWSEKTNIMNEMGCIGVVNLYSNEIGTVKDDKSFVDYATPLLYVISDLLWFRKQTEKFD